MKNINKYRGHAQRIAIGIIMLFLLLACSAAAVLPDLRGTGLQSYGSTPGTDITFSEKTNEIRVIIQFYDEPVLNYAEGLKAELIREQKNTQIAANAKIEKYKDTILNIHSTARNEIKQNNIEIKITREYTGVFNGLAAEISKYDINKLKNLPGIKAVYPDQKVYTLLEESVPLINATKVWQEQNATGANITGKNVKVAIIDTGIDYTHPDLGGGFGPSYKVITGWDVYNNDSDPMDDHGHGTHVAGIVAANALLQGLRERSIFTLFESDVIAHLCLPAM